MGKHTPGPWIVHRRNTLNFDSWAIRTESDYHVAEVDDVNGNPENEANARLIAAVPELLEAANAILEALKNDAELFLPSRLIIQLREAAYKAEAGE